MQQILQYLKTSKVVISFEILDSRKNLGGIKSDYIRIKAALIDGSELHIKEYRTREQRSYSYHWQVGLNMIMRWDNAPHHVNIPTYPHHVHTPKVEPSNNIELQSVLVLLENLIERT